MGKDPENLIGMSYWRRQVATYNWLWGTKV